MFVQYADGGQFIHTGDVKNIDSLIHEIETTFEKAKDFFDQNGLLVNSKKTQLIFIGSYQNIAKLPQNIQVRFDDNLITPSNLVKNLGVYMDCYMTFEKHVDEMSKKSMGTMMYINRIKHNFDKETRILVVQALALSMLNYCSTIWGSANITQIKRIQKLQNFAAKIACGGGRKYDHATPYTCRAFIQHNIDIYIN